MGKFFKVVNFDKFQHYGDRVPPWIKVYNYLLDNYEFGQLSDAGKGHLICIWLLASRKSNKLPFDDRWIATRIQAKSKINLKEMESLGFIECYSDLDGDASNMLASVASDACLEERREEERRERGEETRSNKERSKTSQDDLKNFLDSLKMNPAYKSIDIDRELAKIDAWLQTPKGKRRQKTKGFILNWLNRIDVPVGISDASSASRMRQRPAILDVPPPTIEEQERNFRNSEGVRKEFKRKMGIADVTPTVPDEAMKNLENFKSLTQSIAKSVSIPAETKSQTERVSL
ncbi:MAG: hypothetical protein JNK65_09390 [Deltaproteobacteria bacterium]|nr:hypothetical protein [Deltaproteobacteria bacterium]